MDIPKSEYLRRIRRTKEAMASRAIDALLVYSFRFSAVRYLSGFYPDYSISNAGLLILPLDGEPTLLTRVPAHIDTAKKLSVLDDVRVCKGSSMGAGELDAMAEDCVDVLASKGVTRGKVGIAGYVPERGIEWPLRRLLSGTTVVEANDILDEQRQIKSESELSLCAKSADIANIAFREATDAVRAGLREEKLVAVAEQAMRAQGAETAHVHFGIVRGSKRFHVPFDRTMKRGDRYILEVIPRYKGYVTETAGTFAVGEAPKDVGALHADAMEAYSKAAGFVEANHTTIGELVRSVTGSLTHLPPRGSGWFRLGHGMGLDNLEKPDSLSENDQTVIKSGMVLAVHPYYQLTGLAQVIWGGTFVVQKKAKPLARANARFVI